MKILVIDQCSGSKTHPDTVDSLTIDEVDAYRADENVRTLPEWPARHLYDGRQQNYIDEAVETLREEGHTISRYFISAGFGLVDESKELPPYEVTFSTMTAGEIDDRSHSLDIPADVASLLSKTEYDLAFLAVGSDYARSAQLPEAVAQSPRSTTKVVFNAEELAADHTNVVSISARTTDAKQQETIVVALKGVYLQNFAANLGDATEAPDPDAIKQFCIKTPSTQSNVTDFE